MMEEDSINLKVILLGDTGVGKTSILNRYIHDQYSQNIDPTHGIAFHKQMVRYKNKYYNF